MKWKMNVVDTTTVIAFLGVLSTFILGYLGYRRSNKADTIAQKADAAEQILEGLKLLTTSLQDDNKILRDQVKDLSNALKATIKERDKLKQQVAALHEQYGQAS